MILRNSLTAIALVLLAAAGSETAWAGSASGDQDEIAAKARCIVHSLPRGGQLYRGSDGSIRVRTTGRRGLTARWTISPNGAVAQTGGTAGLARSVAIHCP